MPICPCAKIALRSNGHSLRPATPHHNRLCQPVRVRIHPWQRASPRCFWALSTWFFVLLSWFGRCRISSAFRNKLESRRKKLGWPGRAPLSLQQMPMNFNGIFSSISARLCGSGPVHALAQSSGMSVASDRRNNGHANRNRAQPHHPNPGVSAAARMGMRAAAAISSRWHTVRTTVNRRPVEADRLAPDPCASPSIPPTGSGSGARRSAHSKK